MIHLNMAPRTLAAVLVCIAGLPGIARAEETKTYAFAKKPEGRKDGNDVTITLAVKEYWDVTVATFT